MKYFWSFCQGNQVKHAYNIYIYIYVLHIYIYTYILWHLQQQQFEVHNDGVLCNTMDKRSARIIHDMKMIVSIHVIHKKGRIEATASSASMLVMFSLVYLP